MKNQIKIGSVIAYINIFLNMFVSVFMTPFIIGHLGTSEYGVYRIMSSFSAQLGMITFGIAALVARNVVFYNTKKQKEEKENFLFMAEVESIALTILILVAGMVLYFTIDPLYKGSLLPTELELAKKLYVFLVINVAVNILCDAFTGIIKANERFIVLHLITTFRYVLRVCSLLVLLTGGYGAFAIVSVDLGISCLGFVISVFYSKIILKEKAKFYYFDKELFRSSLAFSLAILLQAVINQVNNNLDNVILGSMKGANVVAVYSVGLMIYGMFQTFVTVVAGMYGPSATRLVANDATGEELTTFAVKPARIQTMLALLIIIGFTIVGQEFVCLWLGEEYIDVYKITLILIIPVTLPLIESITNTILDAKLKRLARSMILAIMCVVNVVVSILLIKVIGYMGAAFGTAISLIIGHGIIMNLYLDRKIGLNIPRLFKEVFRGILPSAALALLCGSITRLLPNGWAWLAIKVIGICIIYGLLMYFIGMNDEEKQGANQIINKLLRR